MKRVLDKSMKTEALASLYKKFRRTPYFDYAYTAYYKLKGIKLVRYLYELFESTKKHWGTEPGMEIACKRGCAYCCHMQVEMSKPEALYLTKHLRKNLTKQEIKELKEKAISGEIETRGAHAAWYAGRKRPCILLDTKTNECTAYEARPMACRRLFSYTVEKCITGFEGTTNDNAWWAGPYIAGEDINAGVAYAMLEQDNYEEFTIDSALAKYL